MIPSNAIYLNHVTLIVGISQFQDTRVWSLWLLLYCMYLNLLNSVMIQGGYQEILSAGAWKGAKARQEDAPTVQAQNGVMQVPGFEIECPRFTTYN